MQLTGVVHAEQVPLAPSLAWPDGHGSGRHAGAVPLVSQYSVRPHVVEPQRGTGAHDGEPFSVKPGLQAPQAATMPDWLQTRFCPSHIVAASPPGPVHVGSFAQLADTHAMQVFVRASNLKFGSHMPGTQTAS